jgi:DNA-binding MarR family transcriptional regulator
VIPLRLWLYIGIAITVLAAAGYVWHLKGKADRVDVLEATLKGERESTRKANEASKSYQADLTRLQSERAKPLSVRLCRPASKPAAPRGSNDAPTGHVSEAAAADIGPDIGDALLEYGIAAEANMLQLERLQAWVRAR